MRFAITLPDSIGDFVLRQPMLTALAARGHSIALVLPSFVAPLAPLIAPQADLFAFRGNPYSPDFLETSRDEVSAIAASVVDWRPDAIVVAPFQRTLLDEYIVDRLAPISSIGMSGILYPGSFDHGLDLKSGIQLTHQVAVREKDHELAKNAALCGTLIGTSIELPPPALQLADTLTQSAIDWLAEKGLEPGRFWAVCAGSHPWALVRNWPPDLWARLCATLVDEFPLSLLFIGTPNEYGFTAEVLRLMVASAERCVNVCDTPPPLALLPGILAQSAGYLGKDSGPMHIAAALQKPVVAVFGGGTWPRFVPAANSGAAVTVGVPCAGCGWVCHLEDSHCVKRVPCEIVHQELRRTITEGGDFRTIVVEPETQWLKEMALEAATLARARLRLLNGELAGLRASAESSRIEGDGLRDRVFESERQLQQISAESTSVRERLREVEQQLVHANEQLVQIREQFQQTNEQLVQAREQFQQTNEQLVQAREQFQQADGQLVRTREQLQQTYLQIGEKSAEADRLARLLKSIRRSVFTRLLVRLGIWRVFRSE
jgi:ADP-heptose:LPS heptosyltransferase